MHSHEGSTMLNLVIRETVKGLYSSAHQTTHENIETFSGKSDCTTWCTWSCKIASYLFSIIQPCKAITGCNNVHEMAAHIIMDPPPYLAVGSRHWGLKHIWLPANINQSRCRKYRECWIIRPYFLPLLSFFLFLLFTLSYAALCNGLWYKRFLNSSKAQEIK